MTAAPRTLAQRNALIRRLRGYGWTYQRIATHVGVSRQRVHKISQNGKR